ncbi:MAG: hypothetical protein HY329_06280, partial [Chloroflexi bacterium]|nr:hypothetical protein [Chloroflexota bacterium]
ALPLLVGCLLLAGVGLALAWASLQTAALAAVDLEDTGVASGIFSTSRYFGSIVGSSLLAGLLGADLQTAGYASVFGLVLVASLLSTIAAWQLR